jgi:hypothetical protein
MDPPPLALAGIEGLLPGCSVNYRIARVLWHVPKVGGGEIPAFLSTVKEIHHNCVLCSTV